MKKVITSIEKVIVCVAVCFGNVNASVINDAIYRVQAMQLTSERNTKRINNHRGTLEKIRVLTGDRSAYESNLQEAKKKDDTKKVKKIQAQIDRNSTEISNLKSSLENQVSIDKLVQEEQKNVGAIIDECSKIAETLKKLKPVASFTSTNRPASLQTEIAQNRIDMATVVQDILTGIFATIIAAFNNLNEQSNRLGLCHKIQDALQELKDGYNKDIKNLAFKANKENADADAKKVDPADVARIKAKYGKK